MILIKILVTVLIVTALTVIAERAGPQIAGILSGYPLGSAISLFFVGVEMGPTFAGQSGLYNAAGLTSLLFFLLVYYLVSAEMPKHSRWLAPLTAVLGFLLAAGAIHQLNLPGWAGVLLTCLAIPLAYYFFRKIDNARINNKVRLGFKVLLFRAGLAALVIVLVTGAAPLLPPSWAGLFTAFPATIFPLLLILHFTYGPEQAQTVIKNVPLGLWSLVAYSIAVWYFYPTFGIYWGTLASFGIATLYLLGLWAGRMILRQRKRSPQSTQRTYPRTQRKKR